MSLNLRQEWQERKKDILNLLFPPRCVACAKSGRWFCSDCQDTIQYIEPPFCPRCGRPTTTARLCNWCREAPPQIDGIRAVAYLEGPLRAAILRFKYSNMRVLATSLGHIMAHHVSKDRLPVDVVVPVPLHPQRLRERGYNQAALLAREVAKAVDLPVLQDGLMRVRSTLPQVGLSARERRDNVRGAFGCVEEGLKGQRILLVDDVCTTGATLDACTIALRERDVQTVWGLVLARERWGQPENGGQETWN